MGKKNALVFRTRQGVIGSQWQTQWENLELHIKTYQIRRLIQKYLETQGLFMNRVYLRHTHQKLWVQVQAFGPHRRTKRFFSLGAKRLKKPRYFSRLVQAIKAYGQTSLVSLGVKTYHLDLPSLGWVKEGGRGKTGRTRFVLGPFRRYKDKPYFLESFQILHLLGWEQLTANYMARFVHAQVRRNPERFAFTAYLGRLLQWFMGTRLGRLRIRGLRIEVKGRFKPGERKKKSLVSLGRISYQEFGSNPNNQIDYSSITAITKFGSLNVQVWLVLYSKTRPSQGLGVGVPSLLPVLDKLDRLSTAKE